MMVATFNSNPSTTIIFYYSPINAKAETDLINFYNELSPVVRSISKHNFWIIGGGLVWFGWFVGFYDMATFVGYLTPNPFLCK